MKESKHFIGVRTIKVFDEIEHVSHTYILYADRTNIFCIKEIDIEIDGSMKTMYFLHQMDEKWPDVEDSAPVCIS